MAGLVPATHGVVPRFHHRKATASAVYVDGRDKPVHDGTGGAGLLASVGRLHKPSFAPRRPPAIGLVSSGRPLLSGQLHLRAHFVPRHCNLALSGAVDQTRIGKKRNVGMDGFIIAPESG